MLIVLIGVSLSSCAANSSGSSPTYNGVTVLDDDNVGLFVDQIHSNVVLTKAYEPAPLAELTEALYFGYVPAPKTENVKIGKLKNKVNIFHLFYRNKI